MQQSANRGESSAFRMAVSQVRKTPPEAAGGAVLRHLSGLGESRETARQPGQFPGCGVLVEHPLGDPAGELGLDPTQRLAGLIPVAGGERRLDLLDEGADAADTGAVDVGATVVAADAFPCLRRVRHLNCLVTM